MTEIDTKPKGLTIGQAASLGDVVIAISDGGQSGLAILTQDGRVLRMPFDVTVEFDSAKGSREGRIRRVKITAGWTQNEINKHREWWEEDDASDL